MSREKQQLKDTIISLNEILELFYQQNNSEAFEKFDEVILEVTKTIDGLERYKNEHQNFEMDEEKICRILTEAMQALQSSDSVLMSDILQYDFVEYMNEILENME